MVSGIKIETASLIFSSLSVLTTTACFFCYGTSLVRTCIAWIEIIGTPEKKLSVDDTKTLFSVYGLYISLNLSTILSVLVIAFTFSIILTKGLLTKNSHLVKGYFIHGVTGTTMTVLFALFLISTVSLKIGVYILLGCFLYSLILMMIRKTYLKLATKENDESCHKDIVAEKTVSINL